MKIALAYINESDNRLMVSQGSCLSYLLNFGQEPIIFNGTPRPFLGDMLKETRRIAGSDPFFGWINSDCSLLVHPNLFKFTGGILGIQRIESNGRRCDGVDAYIFDCGIWDKFYANDIPSLYVGGTHVDWWITRLAQKHGVYHETRALFHTSHQRSDTSKGISHEGQHNLREFSEWAKRNEVKED